MILVFGMVVVGCDIPEKESVESVEEPKEEAKINGTWVWLVPPNQEFRQILSNGSFTFTIYNSETSDIIQGPKHGTYTVSGNIVTYIFDDSYFGTVTFEISEDKLMSTKDSNVVYTKQ